MVVCLSLDLSDLHGFQGRRHCVCAVAAVVAVGRCGLGRQMPRVVALVVPVAALALLFLVVAAALLARVAAADALALVITFARAAAREAGELLYLLALLTARVHELQVLDPLTLRGLNQLVEFMQPERPVTRGALGERGSVQRDEVALARDVSLAHRLLAAEVSVLLAHCRLGSRAHVAVLVLAPVLVQLFLQRDRHRAVDPLVVAQHVAERAVKRLAVLVKGEIQRGSLGRGKPHQRQSLNAVQRLVALVLHLGHVECAGRVLHVVLVV